jgi:outer membrane protein OmpA-like peptidoglycan-associated protein
MRKLLTLVGLSLFVWPVMANVVGADTQNFNPTNDGLDFVTVHSSKTLTPGLMNLGFFLNYAVNSLPNYEDKTTQTRTNFHDSLLSSDLNFAIGLTRNWEAGLSVPALLRQSVESDLNTFHGQFADTGITEYRAMTKMRFWGGQDFGVAGIASANLNQIGDDPFSGTGAGPTYNLELAGDMMLGPFQWGVNAGYRIRNPGRPVTGIPVEPFDDQIVASTALSYLVTEWDTKIIGEIFGSAPVKSQASISDRDASSAELLLGMKTDLSQSLAFHFGGGTEIMHGSASPDWRVYTGINWVIGPLFAKSEEVMVRVNEPPLKSINDLDAVDPYSDPPAVTEAFMARDVLFEFNSDQLKPVAEATLQKLADYLRRPPEFSSLTVEGHTDSIGKPLYNLDLSQRRANRVRQALIGMGLPAERIRAIGYGASRPIANNGNYQGRAMNRRVEFKVERPSGSEVIAPTPHKPTPARKAKKKSKRKK